MFLVNKLVTSIIDSLNLAIGFDQSKKERKKEMTTNWKAPNKSRFHVGNYLKNVFWNAENQ